MLNHRDSSQELTPFHRYEELHTDLELSENKSLGASAENSGVLRECVSVFPRVPVSYIPEPTLVLNSPVKDTNASAHESGKAVLR